MIKTSKGMSFMWTIIIIVILAFIVFGASFYVQGIAQKGVNKLENTSNQVAIKTNLSAKTGSYDIHANAIEGELTLSVTDNNNNGAYITDFSPVTDYKVYDNGVQTTVNDVHAYPVAYIVAVVDQKSTNTPSMLENLSNINFENAYIGVISMASSTTPPEFKNPKEISSDMVGGGSADYWSALATAKQSLPTVTTKPDIGPNFLGVILVSDGRCDASTDICTNLTAISQALDMPRDVHFYLLTSDCQAVQSANGADVNMDRLNHTMESYSELKRASCDTNIIGLFQRLLTDMSTIKVEYEPKFVTVSTFTTHPQSHNITVTITKRTGTLGLQSAYSGTTTVKSEPY